MKEPQSKGVRPVVDPNKAKTSIRITLASGEKTVLELNLDHVVADIHTYVKSVMPNHSSIYKLVCGYPPKELTDPCMTVGGAKL